MTDIRLYQLIVETLLRLDADLRAAQVVVEVVQATVDAPAATVTWPPFIG